MISKSDDSPTSASAQCAKQGLLRLMGLGLITGASDDDASAIGTYSSAGAKFGPSFLWTAPAMFPMMCTFPGSSDKLREGTVRGDP